jgi:hypothetical protein
MYYPFFRGKQYELVTIRENAQLIKDNGFVPIIEPVKESLNGLVRTLTALQQVKAPAILIVNPDNGDYADRGNLFERALREQIPSLEGLTLGVLAHSDSEIEELIRICQRNRERELAIVHSGYPDGADLASALGAFSNITTHVFVARPCSRVYRRHFRKTRRVLLEDGFTRQDSNRKYPPLERFSDLHITYEEENADAFGDFLVVGDEFTESGGPAYAVAIHLTFIDASKDETMFIHHFVSDTTDTPTDPAGKFAEALAKLVREIRAGSPIYDTKALGEFIALHERGHFPGLGYVKKLSMQHHMETLAIFLREHAGRR